MANIRYTDHLKLRLEIRRIPEDYPRIIYEDPDDRYYDIEEERLISIKQLHYNGRIRPMMIAYEEKGDVAEIVTIHPITELKITNRRIRGRWTEP